MGWLALLEQERVQCVILDRRTDSDLIGALRRQRSWAIDFEDSGSVILVRNDMTQQNIEQESGENHHGQSLRSVVP